jgi:RNA polymerase sigma-70 factor (ECF subfamily)
VEASAQVALFLGALDAAQQATAPDPARLSALLERTLAAAGAVEDLPRFLAFLAERAARFDAPLEALAEMDGAVMGLVYRCLAGEPSALAELDATVLEPTSRGLRRMSATDAEISDIRQAVREKLLVGGQARGPRLGDYSGRGALQSWVRVTLVRELLSERRRHQREIVLDDEALFEAATGEQDPELEHLKTYYRAEFRRGFREALEALPGRDRNLLRYHFLEGLSVDEIGVIYGVHRATAARWLVRVRESLEQGTLTAMMGALAVSRPEVESILRLIRSNLDASIASFLEQGGDSK